MQHEAAFAAHGLMETLEGDEQGWKQQSSRWPNSISPPMPRYGVMQVCSFHT